MDDVALIRQALAELPAQCRYHGEHTAPHPGLYPREACCDTGTPAQRRKLAEQALARVAVTASDQRCSTSQAPGVGRS
jgi:hypothetical protein